MVRNGGKYDGVVGVIGALEVISVMDENEYKISKDREGIVGLFLPRRKALIAGTDNGLWQGNDRETCLMI